MTETISRVKGMRDIYGNECALWALVEYKLRVVFARYGYQEIRTPVLEYEKLFKRGVGETSDIVSKEMYSFAESHAENAKIVALRAEGTAPVIRAAIENNLLQENPTRLFYIAPMFRRERPQKGRYRQHHQFGFELIGPSAEGADLDGLLLCYDLLVEVGLKNFVFRINSLGSRGDQANYRKQLISYFEPHRSKLSPDSQRRLDSNPLRILDSKAHEDQDLCQNAPKTVEHLSEKSKVRWQNLLANLKSFDLPFEVDERLVRGLDYYDHTVFEIVDLSQTLGSQNSIAGGGRYNGLCAQLGGPDLSGFGFGCGLERLLMCLYPDVLDGKEPKTLPIKRSFDWGVAATEAENQLLASKVVHELRMRGLKVDWDFEGIKSFKSAFKRADRLGVSKVWILGSQEIESGDIVIKDMGTGKQAIHKLNGTMDCDNVKNIVNALLT